MDSSVLDREPSQRIKHAYINRWKTLASICLDVMHK